MDALEAILSRRSVRRYTQEEVPEEVIDEVLGAAMSAPSAGNGQPWHFIVIRNRDLLDEIPKIHPYSQMITEASLGILVCGDLRLKNRDFWVQDCSAATENLLLAAHAKGLGAVWLGVYPLEERTRGFRKLLSLPKEIMPFALISIGYPAEEALPRINRYDPLKIHNNRW